MTEYKNKTPEESINDILKARDYIEQNIKRGKANPVRLTGAHLKAFYNVESFDNGEPIIDDKIYWRGE